MLVEKSDIFIFRMESLRHVDVEIMDASSSMDLQQESSDLQTDALQRTMHHLHSEQVKSVQNQSLMHIRQEMQ